MRQGEEEIGGTGRSRGRPSRSTALVRSSGTLVTAENARSHYLDVLNGRGDLVGQGHGDQTRLAARYGVEAAINRPLR
jgi:hypothetical protein